MLGSSLAAETKVTSSNDHRLNVRDFGAKADQTTDDTAAFQAATDAAHTAGGGSVFVPAGMYRLNGTLIVKLNVTLEGIFTAPPTIPWTAESLGKGAPNGSVLLTFAGKGDASGTPFIQLAYNATVKGLAVFHPEQTDTNPPIAYPWTICSQLSGADNCSVIDEATNNAPLQFGSCGLFGSMHAANGTGLARIEGGGKVSFTDCHIHCLDPRNTIRTLIHAKSGRLQVRGCDFIDGALPREHIVLEESVLSANISDNTSRTPFTVSNKAKGKTVVRDNLSEG